MPLMSLLHPRVALTSTYANGMRIRTDGLKSTIQLLLSFSNAILEKTGLKMPKAMKTGTTIVGVVYKVRV